MRGNECDHDRQCSCFKGVYILGGRGKDTDKKQVNKLSRSIPPVLTSLQNDIDREFLISVKTQMPSNPGYSLYFPVLRDDLWFYRPHLILGRSILVKCFSCCAFTVHVELFFFFNHTSTITITNKIYQREKDLLLYHVLLYILATVKNTDLIINTKSYETEKERGILLFKMWLRRQN